MPDIDPLDLLGEFHDHGRAFNAAHFLTLDKLRGWLARSRRTRQQATGEAALWPAVLARRPERWRAPPGGGKRGASDSDRARWWLSVICEDFAERGALSALAGVLRAVEDGALPGADELDAFVTAISDIADIIENSGRLR